MIRYHVANKHVRDFQITPKRFSEFSVLERPHLTTTKECGFLLFRVQLLLCLVDTRRLHWAALSLTVAERRSPCCVVTWYIGCPGVQRLLVCRQRSSHYSLSQCSVASHSNHQKQTIKDKQPSCCRERADRTTLSASNSRAVYWRYHHHHHHLFNQSINPCLFQTHGP